MSKVSIITVNYNHHLVTEELLVSVFKTNTYSNIEIIVVDNGSQINPISTWRIQFPSVSFIRSETNLGFAGGNNLGIKHSSGDFLFLVNNDTEFTSGLVQTLLDILTQNPSIGIISPKIKYHDHPEILQYAGFTEMNYFTARNKCIGQFETDNTQFDHLTGPTGFAHGAAMMIKKEAIRKAGLMAENYFLYYEEMDWCEKIKKAGYEIWTCMQAVIYHKESISVGKNSPMKEYFMNRNRILFMRNNANRLHKFVFYLFLSVVIIPRNLLQYLITRNFNYIPLLFKAIWWNIHYQKTCTYLGFQFK